jgi:hypothetical protein
MTFNQGIRSQDEAKAAVAGSLRTIKTLCQAYDNGHFDAERDIASVIHRMLIEELYQTNERRNISFLSYALPPNPENLLLQLLASAMEVNIKSDGGDPTITVTHKPLLDTLVPQAGPPSRLRFNQWWKGLVLIGGASDGPAIPVDARLQIPYDKRERFTRSVVVETFRNRTGAHYDRKVDAATKMIEDRLMRNLDIVIEVGQVSFSYAETPGVFRLSNSRAGAIVRHIAFELLETFEMS